MSQKSMFTSLSKEKHPVLLVFLLLVCLILPPLFLFLTDSAAGALLLSVLAAVGTIGLGAYFVRRPGIGAFLFLLPVAFGICLAVSREPILSLAILIFIPSALVLAFAIDRKLPRNESVALLTVTLLLSLFAALVFTEIALTGSFSFGEIMKKLESFRDKQSALLSAFITETYEELKKLGAGSSNPLFESIDPEAFSPDIFSALINRLILLLPVLITVVAEIIALLASSLTFGLLLRKSIPEEEHPDKSLTVLCPSRTGSVVFALSLFFSIMPTSDAELSERILVIATEINMVLLPFFFLAGLFFLIASFRSGRVTIHVSNIIFFAFILLCFPSFLPYYFAFYGIILAFVSRKKSEGEV